MSPSKLAANDFSAATIRVLLVDDSADDRALVRRELRREFRHLQVTEAADLKSLEAAFEQPEGFDVVITDYQICWSNGLAVVTEARIRWPGAAVIMFTGSGNEEVAVEAMKAGVDDYVLKAPKHFPRLRSAVQMALRLHKERKKLDQAELRYKTLFDTVPVGLFRCTPSGRLLDANMAFAQMLRLEDRGGVREETMLTLHPTPEHFEKWRDELEREGSVAFIESQFKTGDGRLIWVEIHAKALRDPETQAIYYEGSVEDITARKHAERDRERLIQELREALSKVKLLTGLLPICAHCKKIRDEKGAWNILELFIENHSNAHFTHSFCPDCVRRLYPEVFLDTPKI